MFQIAECSSDDELRSYLSEDATMDILLTAGYRGVMAKETLSSVKELQRYSKEKFLIYNIEFIIVNAIFAGKEVNKI